MASALAHTEGPWIVDAEPLGSNDPPPVLRVRTMDKPAAWIAQVSTWHMDEAPDVQSAAKANARLIAAAPDLYAVVAAIVQCSAGDTIPAALIKEAQSAIAKTRAEVS